jgi:hypothetical protein
MIITGFLTVGLWATSFQTFWNFYGHKNNDWEWDQHAANPKNQRS